jgi:hypothetical protein
MPVICKHIIAKKPYQGLILDAVNKEILRILEENLKITHYLLDRERYFTYFMLGLRREMTNWSYPTDIDNECKRWKLPRKLCPVEQ